MGWSEDEALDLRDEYKRNEERIIANKLYFSSYGLEWLKAYKSHLTTGPYNTHVRNLNKFMDVCGDRYIYEYKPSDISRFYQSFVGKSASTINSARDTVKGVFKAALADGYIMKDPTESITPPKGPKGTHRAITQQERALIHATEHRLRPAVMVMLYAGLRKGEALARDIDRDVNFAARTITVRQAVRHEGIGSASIVRPKTEAGIRTIPMLDIVYAELYGKHGLLCPSASGQLMSMSAWA